MHSQRPASECISLEAQWPRPRRGLGLREPGARYEPLPVGETGVATAMTTAAKESPALHKRSAEERGNGAVGEAYPCGREGHRP